MEQVRKNTTQLLKTRKLRTRPHPDSQTVSGHDNVCSSYQVSDAQHAVELVGHGVVLHGHEERVEDDADGDGQIQEGVHHHDLHQLLHPQPAGAALPHQVTVGEGVPARVTLLMGLLQFCSDRDERQERRESRPDTRQTMRRMKEDSGEPSV